MPFGSRQKGSKAELVVAAMLQEWWRQVEPECLVCRTPLSGGWGKPEHREGFQSGGDVMTNAATFPFAVEIKRREQWVWRRLELGSASPVWGWYRQAIKAADEMKKQPMLWFKKNNEPWLVFVPHELDGRIPQAVRAKKVWVPAELMRVDYGGVLPVCYEAEQLLRAPARLFAASKAA